MDRVDVVIVGAGTAGIPAALEAADGGARVVLVDKRPDVGGMLHVSGGHFSGAGTRRQRERGIEDAPAAHLADAERISHGRGNRALMEVAIAHQGAMVDWLEERGFDFHPDTPRFVYGHELYGVPRTFHGRDDGRSLLRLFERELVSRSIDVRLLSRVTRLLPGEHRDRVNGVEVAGPEGSYELEADAVVLATGGYAANRQLLERLLPADFGMALTACLDHATGDGLVIAEALGAAVTDYGYYIPTMAQIPDPDRPGFTLAYDDARLMLVAAARRPYEVWVNTRGERFVAEDTESPEERERALLEQPGLKMAVVWDQAIMEATEPIVVPGWTRGRIEAEAARGRFIWRAPTLDELASRLGVDATGLRTTLEHYNQAVAAGEDRQFGRRALPMTVERPPFYGIVSQASMLMSREGLKVDTDLRVLRADGRAFENLYAIGEVLGASQLMGDSFVGGMSVGPAITFGRLVGQRLAAAARVLSR
jgi:fumarate reductase flavoprotein subunit